MIQTYPLRRIIIKYNINLPTKRNNNKYNRELLPYKIIE